MINKDKPEKLSTEYLLCVLINEYGSGSFYGNVLIKTELNILDNYEEFSKLVYNKSIEQLKMLKLWNENGSYHIAITNIIMER